MFAVRISGWEHYAFRAAKALGRCEPAFLHGLKPVVSGFGLVVLHSLESLDGMGDFA